jgi:phage baseplate assembly protein W
MQDVTHDLSGRIDGLARCLRAIETILTTRKGTRVMRRDFGSDLLALIDRPMNEMTIMDAIMSVVEPINTWEPEFQVKRVLINEASSAGNLDLTIEGIYKPLNTAASLTINARA